MKIAALKKALSDWLTEHLRITGKRGFILGISGGVDSCVLTHLLAASKIPYRSIHYVFDEQETQGSNMVIDFLRAKTDLNIDVVDHRIMFSACYANVYKGRAGAFEDHLFRAILKGKLAHVDLSYRASQDDYLVLGTINLDEFTLGYFVKNTCIGDLLPFADLPKRTIRELGVLLGLPVEVCAAKASGCVYGTTAEEEWGFTEEEVFHYVSGQREKLSAEVMDKISAKEKAMNHKRAFPPIFRQAHGAKTIQILS